MARVLARESELLVFWEKILWRCLVDSGLLTYLKLPARSTFSQVNLAQILILRDRFFILSCQMLCQGRHRRIPKHIHDCQLSCKRVLQLVSHSY